MFIKSGGNPLVHAIEKLKITTTVAQLCSEVRHSVGVLSKKSCSLNAEHGGGVSEGL